MLTLFKKLSLADVFSLLNLSSGFLGIATCNVNFIFISAIFDGIDGTMARRTGKSEFGGELDSLADLVSFGVFPAYVLYTSYHLWIALAYLACSALRLARFNVLRREDFTGLPITASALILASLVKLGILRIVFAVSAIFLSLLMVCDVRYPKVKGLRIFVAGFAVLLALLNPLPLLILCLIYVLSPLWGCCCESD